MHTLRNRMLFFGATLAAGTASLGLHRYMMANCIDEKGLLAAGNLPGILLWVVGIGFFLFLTVMLHTIGGDGSYADNFPPCRLSGGLMIAAGITLLPAIGQLELEGEAALPGITGIPLLVQQGTTAIMAYLPWAAAVCMIVLGVYRMLGKRPCAIFSGLVCFFYMLMLVNNYRLWSADPQLHTYAYQLLAQALLMLCSFHRTCCDGGIIQREKLLFTGLSAAVCAMAALSMDFQRGFFLASSLWATGCMCNVAVLPPDPEPEEPEEPAEPEQTDETEDKT